MAASPKTQKTAGSARKASGTKEKGSGSAQQASSGKRKTTAGSASKASGSKQKTAAGSAQKAGTGAKRGTTGSKQKASAGSGQKASTGSGSRQKASAGSGQKASTGSGSRQKASTGSGQKASTGSGSRQKASTGSGQKASTGSGQKAGSGSRQKAGAGVQQRADAKSAKGIYVYGILPADVELASEMSGVGAGQVRIVRSDGLAALVSEVDTTKPLGSPEDLTAHQQIVDASAAEVPVLPARFGAVMESEEAVAEDLLGANEDEFHDALSELDGRAQYVIKGRYVEQAILKEVLSENRQAARLASKLRGADPDATRDARIKLGEIINNAVAAKRHKDTHALGNAMEGHCVASIVREPTHELDAAHVAFLVETGEEGDVQQVVEDLARDWEGRIEVRLLGPMAAYDFVGSVVPEG